MKTYVVGASNEYHNICFHREIRKILSEYPSYYSGAINKYLEEHKLRVNIFCASRLLIDDSRIYTTDDRL